MSHGKSSGSSGNNLISHPDILPSKNPPIAVTTMPQNITNLTNANNNWQQNLMGQHNLNRMILAQSGNDNTMTVQSGLLVLYLATFRDLKFLQINVKLYHICIHGIVKTHFLFAD